MENVNYDQKYYKRQYYKYKNKYLKLKKQYGGIETIYAQLYEDTIFKTNQDIIIDNQEIVYVKKDKKISLRSLVSVNKLSDKKVKINGPHIEKFGELESITPNKERIIER